MQKKYILSSSGAGQSNFSNEKAILRGISGNNQIWNIKTQFKTYIEGMPHNSSFLSHKRIDFKKYSYSYCLITYSTF